MDDEQLAAAWESFATALHDVPRQREWRRQLNEMLALECERMARRNYEMMRHAPQGQYWGMRPGIFGLGITL